MTTENSDTETEAESTEDDVNISRLRQMAVRGKQYTEEHEFTYYGETGTLYLSPLPDTEFLPIAAAIEEKLDVDIDADDFEEQGTASAEEAKERLEEAREDDEIDASELDQDFVKTIQRAAAKGIDTSQGIAEGEDEEGVKEIVSMLQGGKSLVIGEKVLELSSDAEKAEAFRRDGGRE